MQNIKVQPRQQISYYTAYRNRPKSATCKKQLLFTHENVLDNYRYISINCDKIFFNPFMTEADSI